jgi:arsenate reductase (glutaredoxin)
VLLLEESGVEFTKVEYLKNPLNKDEILSLSNKLGMVPSGFIRKREASYIENNLEEISNNNEAMAEAIEKFPKIMERPIAVKGAKAVIGRPPENILTLLD